jgi:quercetin dioxygenase-like cupin family protein
MTAGGADAFTEKMRASGYPVTAWSNGPGERYAPHAHSYRKILCCLEGSIVFHTADGDVELQPGERLVIDPGREHGATVGPSGVRCAEARASESQ